MFPLSGSLLMSTFIRHRGRTQSKYKHTDTGEKQHAKIKKHTIYKKEKAAKNLQLQTSYQSYAIYITLGTSHQNAYAQY